MYQERLAKYRELEALLNGKVLSYVTSDRPAFETVIDWSAIDPLARQLEAVGATDTIILYLLTRGGDTSAAWNIVNLVRMYCSRLIALIPHRAHSAGTIIAIGADEIVMTRQATLGPIDPHESNPLIPKGDDGTPFPVSVEAVDGYIQFARKELGVKDPAIILERLSQYVHPLVLGQAYRSRAQVASLARRLLRHQIESPSVLERTASFLCGGCGSHDYTIDRKEALEDLGLRVSFPDERTDRLMKDILRDFSEEIMGPPQSLMGRDDIKSVKAGFAESVPGGSSYYSYDYKVTPAEDGQTAQTKLLQKGWQP